MGEQHNVSEASKKRKSPLDGPPSRFGPSARRTQIKHIETVGSYGIFLKFFSMIIDITTFCYIRLSASIYAFFRTTCSFIQSWADTSTAATASSSRAL